MRPSFPTDLSAIRENNLSAVLTIIRQVGSISRADLARKTHLSATTISALANVLLSSGFVRESGMGESSGGRRPILLQFDYKFRHVLGVDMGATHLVALVMDLQGQVMNRQYMRFPVMQEPEGTMQAICQLVEQVLTNVGLSLQQILGMGVTVPAPLEGESLEHPSHIILPAWQGHDLLGFLQSQFPFPIYLDNDANGGAIAEKWWGRGRSFANLAYIKLGTGVGSGLIVKNEIYRGDGGTAGEIGHTTIDADGPVCRCGNRGCLESFVGATAVMGNVAHALVEQGTTAHTQLSLDEIATAVHQQEPLVSAVIEQTGTYLGIAIANLINLFNPGLIVLGGEITKTGDLLVTAVRNSAHKRAMPKAAQEAIIAISELGDDAIAMGAATLAIDYAFQPAQLANTLQNESSTP